mgnify:CR=1 FL=1|tara:strand:- start:1522 stop:1920 length:399 start_codon:yes stop_codon:yes gene_type:complete
MAQNFFIRKNSQLPILKMKVNNDGRNDYKKIFEDLENAAITFSMKEMNCSSCKYKVFNKQALIIPVEDDLCGTDVEYYIGYKFSKKETNQAGVFRGEFKIDFLDDTCTLIVPIREELIINVLDSQTNTRIIC